MDRILTRIENAVMAVLLFAGLVVGVAAVILRYVFNTGVVWSEGILITVTVWGVLIGASQAIAQGIHARVDVIIDLFPRALRRAVQIVTAIAIVAYCLFIGDAGVRYVAFVRQIGSVSVDTGVPDWITYGIVPVAMAIFSVRYLLEIRRLVLGEADRNGAGDAGRPHPGPQ